MSNANTEVTATDNTIELDALARVSGGVTQGGCVPPFPRPFPKPLPFPRPLPIDPFPQPGPVGAAIGRAVRTSDLENKR